MSRARLLLVLAGLLLLHPLFALRPYVNTKPYDMDEAYKVYSAILLTVGEHPLVIGAETRTPEICLQPLNAQSEKVLRPAIDSYLELNALPWQLQNRRAFWNIRYGVGGVLNAWAEILTEQFPVEFMGCDLVTEVGGVPDFLQDLRKNGIVFIPLR